MCGRGGEGDRVVVRDSATQYCCSAAPVASRGMNSRMGRNESNANYDVTFEQEPSHAKW